MMRLVAEAGNSCLTIKSLIVLLTICRHIDHCVGANSSTREELNQFITAVNSSSGS